ncbi:MAG: hypothetical protein LC775_17090 [Acidobacteria bacterium]|nr:hypothetical protein [Acidobacteriota bacterium]
MNDDRSNAEALRPVHVWLKADANVFEGLTVRFVVPGLTVDAPHVATHVCERGESFWLRDHPDHYDPDVLPVDL